MRILLLAESESGLAMTALCPFTCRYWYIALLTLAIYLWPLAQAARQEADNDDPSFAHIVIGHADYARAPNWLSSSKKHDDFVSLPEIARLTMYRYFAKTESRVCELESEKAALAGAAKGSSIPVGASHKNGINEWVSSSKIEPQFRQAAGVFVTLSKDGKTRACWGSVYPREANIARETVIATLGALSKEYRFKPISATELKELKIQVTVVRGLEAVSNVKMINPYRDGVMVRSGGRGGVILPGEAVDAYYELVLARLKAGIKPDEPCQIYRIRAEIYD